MIGQSTEGVKAARVLVVDDCGLSRALVKAGYTVYVAESGAMAVEALVGAARQRRAATLELPRFDILVIDVNMPGLSGPETVKLIRARGSVVPIIACTGSESDRDRDECLTAGCNGYVTKPFRPEALVEACRSVLKLAA